MSGLELEQRRFTARDTDDTDAFGGEQDRDGPTDPGARSCDDGDLALQLVVHHLLLEHGVSAAAALQLRTLAVDRVVERRARRLEGFDADTLSLLTQDAEVASAEGKARARATQLLAMLRFTGEQDLVEAIGRP